MIMRGLFTSLALALVGTVMSTGCVTTVLGQGPTDQDLANNGDVNEQLDLYRNYEVVYERGQLKRPGADPAAVAAEAQLSHIDAVAAPAYSDDAFNYLSSSKAAAEYMDHPAVAFDGFARSGMGETVILGVSVGGGIVAGGVAWFVNTTVRDGISAQEYADLSVSTGSGIFLGTLMGVIVAGAYTYIIPAISSPLAVPLYRKAASTFNEDLEDRILEGAPPGDPPPVEAEADDADDAGDEGDSDDDGDDDDADAGDDADGDAPPPAIGEGGEGSDAATPPAATAPAPITPRAN